MKPIRTGTTKCAIGELGDLLTQVQVVNVRAMTRAARAAAPEVLRRIQHAANRNIDERDKVYTGKLRRGWRIIKTARGAELVNTAPYAGDVEAGRLPGLPVSYADILDWTYGKLVVRGDISPWEAEQFAENVTKKIHRDGTQPSFILVDAIDEVDERELFDVLERAAMNARVTKADQR